MEKQFLFHAFIVFGSAIIACSSGATQYMVGDSSGWDISTNLDSWAKDKTFSVGDVLMFQYSSSHSVSEVTKENFNTCNTTNALQTFNSTGNNTVTLDKPGDKFFVCGNKLHCLGGMRMKLSVESNQAFSPAGSPQATISSDGGSNDSNPSSKTDKQFPNASSADSISWNYNVAFVLVFVGGFVSLFS